MSENEKSKITPAQKRLLWLVYIMGGVMVALFVAVLATIIWQLSHHH